MAVKVINGVKYYPVCNWYRNQHKLYNYNDKMAIKAYDEGTAEAWEALEESERLLAVFDGNVYNGVVYASYKDYCKIKDIIGGYDMKTDIIMANYRQAH